MQLKMSAKAVHAEKIFPIMAVLDGIAISVNGTLTMGYKLTLPSQYSCTEAEYDDIITSFSSAIGVLPPWTIIHRQDIFTRSEWMPSGDTQNEFLSKSYMEFHKGRSYMTHQSYIYISLSNKGMIDKSGNSSGMFGLSNVKVPDKGILDNFRAKAREFSSLVSGSGLVKLSLMDEKDWMGEGDSIGVIQKVMMLGEESPIMSDIVLAPDAIRVKEKTAVCYTIGDSDQLPTEVSSVKRIDRLSSEGVNNVFLSTGSALGVELDCEHIVNQFIVVPQQEEILKSLEAEKKKMQSGLNSSDNRVNHPEIQKYLDDAYKYGLVTILANINILAWSSEEDVDTLSARVSTAISSMNGTTAVRNLYNTPVVYYASIPGCECDISKENLMKMELVSMLCTGLYETFDNGTGRNDGVLMLSDRTRHQPVNLDTQMIAQELGWINNYNMFVIGGSGTGKSFFMNTYTRNLYSKGQYVFIIDNGDSYEGLCSVINEETDGRDGQYMSWDADRHVTFNPFTGFTTWIKEDGSLNMEEPGINCFLSFLKTVYEPERGWLPSNEAILNQTVLDFIRYALDQGLSESDLPILDDYYSYIGKEVSPKMTKHQYIVGDEKVGTTQFNMKDFRLSLKAYAKGGEFASLLNEKKPKDLFNSRFIVFEVSKLADVKDKKYYSICILLIMNAFELKMRNESAVKNLVIEEAWKAIANETMAPYLRSLWKTARKYSTSCVVVTQEMNDIISSNVIRDAILMNSDIRVLLDQANNRNILTAEENLGDKDIRTMLGLSPKEIDIILSLNRANDPKLHYKEVFIKFINGRYGVYATIVSPEEALCYESNKIKKAPLLKAAKDLGSFIKAVKAFAKKLASVSA